MDTPCTRIMTIVTIIMGKEKETIIMGKEKETIIMVTEKIIRETIIKETIIINVAMTIIIKGEMIDIIRKEVTVTRDTNTRKGAAAETGMKMIESDLQ